MAKPIILVYGLGEGCLSEEGWGALHRRIVEVARSFVALHVDDEDDLFVWFPKDHWSYGLGTKILIQVNRECLEGVIWESTRFLFCHKLIGVVQNFFPKADVDCDFPPDGYVSRPARPSL